MQEIFVINGARTPVGILQGAFSEITAIDLGVIAARETLRRVNGGGISIGHPLAASGIRLIISLMYELKRNNLKYGVAALCIGGGQGIAAVIESIH